jgi:hypothetical protein
MKTPDSSEPASTVLAFANVSGQQPFLFVYTDDLPFPLSLSRGVFNEALFRPYKKTFK